MIYDGNNWVKRDLDDVIESLTNTASTYLENEYVKLYGSIDGGAITNFENDCGQNDENM